VEVPKYTFKITPINAKSTSMPDSETARIRRMDMDRLQPPVMTYFTVIWVATKMRHLHNEVLLRINLKAQIM
jgi:hypothetical protein